MKMKTAKTKRTGPSAPSMTKRMVGADGLLKIAARLKDQVQKADTGPGWRERTLAALADPDRKEGIIRSVQIQRDAGVMDADEAVFMLSMFAGQIAEDRYDTDAELKRINQAVDVANKAHGLPEDCVWNEDEVPDELQKLYAAWDRRADGILADVLREHGEAVLADLLLSDHAAFHARVEPGRAKMFGQLPKELAEGIEAWKKSQTTGPCE